MFIFFQTKKKCHHDCLTRSTKQHQFCTFLPKCPSRCGSNFVGIYVQLYMVLHFRKNLQQGKVNCLVCFFTPASCPPAASQLPASCPPAARHTWTFTRKHEPNIFYNMSKVQTIQAAEKVWNFCFKCLHILLDHIYVFTVNRYSLYFLFRRCVMRTFQIPVHFQIVLYPPPFPYSSWR